jgi:hypothetical protein
MSWQTAKIRRPNAVNITPLLVRTQSGTPTWSSSRLRAALMLGCCRLSARPAAPMPPRRPISEKILNRFQSMLREKVSPASDIDFDLLI